MTAKLQVFASMGEEFSVGWKRDDAPLIHVFAQAKPGHRFTPGNGRGGLHWPCPVCDAHGFTEGDFYEQIADALKRGPP